MTRSRAETQTNIPVLDTKGILGKKLRDRRTAPSDTDDRLGSIARSISVMRGDKETRLPLREDEKYTFGRAASCDVVFDDDRVSRQQGVLRFQNARWWFFDFGSSNGTLIGPAAELRRRATGDGDVGHHFRRMQVGEPTALQPGDAVVLGTRRAWFELNATALADSATSGLGGARDARSAATRDFERKLEIAARTDLPVFLLGQSGSGKTHAARVIHERSASKGHFVIINCARLPTDVGQLHSELLGHVKGGFTGAIGDRVGKLLHANGGTLFLDEVESLPDVAQGFLLDLLEGTGDLAALGASPSKAAVAPPRFRLISASKSALASSGLRLDLCERLAQGYTWRVPTLEDRRDDIPGLIDAFLRDQRETRGIEARFTQEAIDYATAQRWPGQIRELRSMVVALVQAANAHNEAEGRAGQPIVIDVSDLRARMREREEAFEGAKSDNQGVDVSDVATFTARLEEKRPVHPKALTAKDIRDALDAAGGNRSSAARALGVARNTLAARMRAFGLDR